MLEVIENETNLVESTFGLRLYSVKEGSREETTETEMPKNPTNESFCEKPASLWQPF
jgi:hypothetical protein